MGAAKNTKASAMPFGALAGLQCVFTAKHRARVLAPGTACKWPLTVPGVTYRRVGRVVRGLETNQRRTWLGLAGSKEALA